MIHVLLIPLLLAAPAAPAPAPAADAANVAKAKELFQAGQKLYKAGKYAEAIARFEEAYAARPHPVIFFNIGKCWEQLSENAKALRAYRDYLRLAPDAKDRDTVMDAMANLERRLREKGLQQLLVYAEPATARIVVDGKDIGTSPASIELVAGSHKLEVSAPTFEKYERTFNFTITRATEMTVTLEPPKSGPVASDAPRADPKNTEPKSKLDPGPPPPPPPMVSDEPAKKGGRLWAYVVGGVAVASAGAGVGLGVAANGEAAKFTGMQHDPATVNQEFAAARDASNGLATGANVAYAVAGAAAITAVVLFILEK